jgi:hypothetical protein
MTFATELEQLLDKYTTYRSYPATASPDHVSREWHTCDLCEQEAEEAWAIKHNTDCMAGKCQEALING